MSLPAENPQYVHTDTHSLDRYRGAYSRTVRPKRRTVLVWATWARSSRRWPAAADSSTAKRSSAPDSRASAPRARSTSAVVAVAQRRRSPQTSVVTTAAAAVPGGTEVGRLSKATATGAVIEAPQPRRRGLSRRQEPDQRRAGLSRCQEPGQRRRRRGHRRGRRQPGEVRGPPRRDRHGEGPPHGRRVAGGADGRVDEDRAGPHLHGEGGVARRPDPGVDDHWDGGLLDDDLQRRLGAQALVGADPRAERHDRGAAHLL